MMKQIFYISTIALVLAGCKNYENQPRYEIEVGEEVNIYYSTNSCCVYCMAEEQNLSHLFFVKSETIDSGPRDCAGCNYIAAYIFKGTSPGIDTVKLKTVAASKGCSHADVVPEIYVVEVK